MRLDPAEVPELPFPAALLDRTGHTVAASLEWAGAVPGSLAFRAGTGHLLIGPASPTRPELDVLMARLLGALEESAPAMEPEARLRAAVLIAGLELVSGRPLATSDRGTTSDVLKLAQAAIRMRAPGLSLELGLEERPRPVPAPATIALALVQFAVNAATYEFTDVARTRRVETVRLRVAPGPSFYLEWRSEQPADVPVRTSRHQRRRARWGWGYVRMAADALGGVALPPGRTGEGLEGACFSIGSPLLTVPLACFEHQELSRCTQSWEQETRYVGPAERDLMEANVRSLLALASNRPAQIVHLDLLSARTARSGRTWLALPPETGSSRVRDVLRGLGHERTLWSAPEPHATRVLALAALLARAVGEELPTSTRGDWTEVFPRACRSLGLEPPEVHGAAVYPEPRVTAYLLAAVGGTLSVRDGVVEYWPPPEAESDPLVTLFRPTSGGPIRLTPDLERLFR